METWLLIIIAISISYLLKLIFNYVYSPTKQSPNLPPGPFPYPIIGNLLLFRRSFCDPQPVILSLRKKFGPIITLYFGSRPAIFIADRYLAHQALVKDGTAFASRPLIFDGSNQHHVSTAFYGSKWRALRRTLTAEILQHSGLRSYAHVRKWAVERLLNTLKLQSKSGNPVRVLEHFQFTMFSLISAMCFGQKFEDNIIKEIEDVSQHLISTFGKVSMVYMASILPSLTRFICSNEWDKMSQIGVRQKELFTPFIKERTKVKEQKSKVSHDSYVDKLLDLYLDDENRKLTDTELISLCSEFLTGGTHGTTSMIEWIMANLVKYPHVQHKLFEEIKRVIGDGAEMVNEEDLPKIPYLRAVILEGLRKHPPGSFLLPHTVTEDVVLNDYVVPKNGLVFILTGDMGMDPNVWEDPTDFKPERFLNEENDGKPYDITAKRETKMMPFGTGMRVCPGYAMAILNLQYLVANLIWSFEWKAEDVDLEPIRGFVTVMKNHLEANLLPRF